MSLCVAIRAGMVASLFALTVSAGDLSETVEHLHDAEIATIGMDPYSRSPVVMLRDLESGRLVPIWIGFPEAQSILMGMQGVEPPRPITHDLSLALLEATRWSIREVVVHGIESGVYLGRIELISGDDGDSDRTVEVKVVDSRPSDALALAVRRGVPIRVAESVLAAGEDFQFMPPSPEDQVVRFREATVVAISPAIRERLDLPETAEGVVVSHVASTGPAESVLRKGDWIQSVDEMPVSTPMEFLEAVSSPVLGREVRLGIVRDGETIEVVVPSLRSEPDPERLT